MNIQCGNLLSEPLIGISDAGGTRAQLSLPQVLARLADVSLSTVAFTAMQAHQTHSTHAFLVQVAAMICQRAETETPTTDAAWWAVQLCLLGGGDAAWTLVVSDLGQPAFLQPPVPEGRVDGFANLLATPGALDLLVTAKNHDRKLETGAPGDLAAWMFALISLQTGQGYSGKANYGVFRMNGGLGNRPGVGLRSGHDLGVAFRRDLAALRAARSGVLERGMYSDDGIPLLWCEPWDGMTSTPWKHLDPWAIECCRRVRLRATGDQVEAVMTSTKAPRISVADEYTGNSGDPWTPVNVKTGKSLTLPGVGFTYARVAELLLTTEWERPAAQEIQAGDTEDLHWYGRALVRGQGKTEGWHDRDVLIEPKMRSRFAKRDERARLAQVAMQMVGLAKVMRLNILKPTLLSLWEDADGPIASGLLRLEQQIDAGFFPHLWEHPDSLDPWRATLHGWASAILDEDAATLGPTADRWKRISAAYARFSSLLHHKKHPDSDIFIPLPSREAPTP